MANFKRKAEDAPVEVSSKNPAAAAVTLSKKAKKENVTPTKAKAIKSPKQAGVNNGKKSGVVAKNGASKKSKKSNKQNTSKQFLLSKCGTKIPNVAMYPKKPCPLSAHGCTFEAILPIEFHVHSMDFHSKHTHFLLKSTQEKDREIKRLTNLLKEKDNIIANLKKSTNNKSKKSNNSPLLDIKCFICSEEGGDIFMCKTCKSTCHEICDEAEGGQIFKKKLCNKCVPKNDGSSGNSDEVDNTTQSTKKQAAAGKKEKKTKTQAKAKKPKPSSDDEDEEIENDADTCSEDDHPVGLKDNEQDVDDVATLSDKEFVVDDEDSSSSDSDSDSDSSSSSSDDEE